MGKKYSRLFKKSIPAFFLFSGLLSVIQLPAQANNAPLQVSPICVSPMLESGLISHSKVAADAQPTGLVDTVLKTADNSIQGLNQKINDILTNIINKLPAFSLQTIKNTATTLSTDITECTPNALISYVLLPNRQGLNIQRFLLIPAFVAGCTLSKTYKKLFESLIAHTLHDKDRLGEDMFSEKALARALQTGTYILTGLALHSTEELFAADRHFIEDINLQFSSVPKIEIITTTKKFWTELYQSNATQQISDSKTEPSHATTAKNAYNLNDYIIGIIQLIPPQILEKMHYIMGGGLLSYGAYKTAEMVTSRIDSRVTKESLKKFILHIIPAAYLASVHTHADPTEKIGAETAFRVGIFTEIFLVAIVPFLYRQIVAR